MDTPEGSEEEPVKLDEDYQQVSLVNDDKAEKDFQAPSEERPRLSIWMLLLIASPWLGIQAVWSLEFALTGAYLYEVVGLPKSYSILVFILGPLTGMTVGPLVGALSDNCTSSWGRRRPFLLFGILVVVGSSLIFASSLEITQGNQTPAAVLAFISFGILDAFMNVLQGPLRALLADMAHTDQQEMAQSFGSLFQGAGTILGFYLVPALGGIDHIFLTFGVACGALVLCSLPVVFFAREEVYSPEEEVTLWPIIRASFTSLYWGLLDMHSDMTHLCIIQFFSWASWFSYSTVATFYCIEYIFDGKNISNHSSDEYKNITDEGTAFSATVNAHLGIVQLIFSLALPFIIKLLPTKIDLIKDVPLLNTFNPLKIVYILTLIPFGTIFLIISFLEPSKLVYAILICFIGISYSGMNVFPYAICGRLFTSEAVGTNMGILNIFICIPMLISNFVVMAILAHYNEKLVLLLSGVSGIIATIACLFVKIPQEQTHTILIVKAH